MLRYQRLAKQTFYGPTADYALSVLLYTNGQIGIPPKPERFKVPEERAKEVARHVAAFIREEKRRMERGFDYDAAGA